MKQLFKKIFSALKDTCFPATCLACHEIYTKTGDNNTSNSDIFKLGALLAGQDEKRLFETIMQPFLCKNCITKYTPITTPICTSCGMMFKERVSEDHLCGACIKTPSKLRIARSAGIYDQSLLNLVRAYKFGRKLQLAAPLGVMVSVLYQKTYWDTKTNNWSNNCPDLIIPVPLHKKRFRKRKFNQAWLLIKDWQHLKVNNTILIRPKLTKPQTGLDKKTRKTNIKGAFCLNNLQNMNGKKILIIDDVYTTGATADECANVLLNSGAKHVDVLTIARTEV